MSQPKGGRGEVCHLGKLPNNPVLLRLRKDITHVPGWHHSSPILGYNSISGTKLLLTEYMAYAPCRLLFLRILCVMKTVDLICWQFYEGDKNNPFHFTPTHPLFSKFPCKDPRCWKCCPFKFFSHCTKIVYVGFPPPIVLYNIWYTSQQTWDEWTEKRFHLQY